MSAADHRAPGGLTKIADRVTERLLRGLLTALPRLPADEDHPREVPPTQQVGEPSLGRRRPKGRSRGLGR